MEILQGEQLYRYIGGSTLSYEDCEQILITVYNATTRVVVANYLKVADDAYPDAGVIEQSDVLDFEFMVFLSSEFTNTLPIGTYYMELERTVLPTITKDTVEFITVTDSIN